MLTPKQIQIFETFLNKPYHEFTYREIKDSAKEKSNSILQRAIQSYLHENLVTKRQVGNMILYTANLKNEIVTSYFNIIINNNLPPLVKKTLQLIESELCDIPFSSIVIFGSYANNTYAKESDLDIALLVNSQKDKKNGELALKSAELKSILRLDVHVFTVAEMLQMLKDKNENLGKQIASKNLAVYNPAIFYSIVQTGIDNGFQIVYSKS